MAKNKYNGLLARAKCISDLDKLDLGFWFDFRLKPFLQKTQLPLNNAANFRSCQK